MNIQDIYDKFNLEPNQVLNIYQYGSRVYGCNSEDSDYDFILVVKNGYKVSMMEEPWQLKNYNVDITVYNEDKFKTGIEAHEISLLECLFLPKDKVWKEDLKVNFQLDLYKLRESISQKSSNSFVKCKKKFIIEKDYNPYIGKKSLFHSLRIIMFGIQIAKYGKIINYTEANQFWNDIINTQSDDWEYFKKNYQSVYNNLKSEFRTYCPKTQDNN